MNKKLLLCGIASLMAAFSFVACEDDDDDNNGGDSSNNVKVEGSLVDTSDPRENAVNKDTMASYSFDMQKKEGTLQLLDVFRSSCPNAKYSSTFDFKNDSIKITLSDDTPDNTVCGAPLYRDFTYKFTGLDAKKYNISVFTKEGISINSFDLDLTIHSYGFIIKEESEELNGTFHSRSACKNDAFEEEEDDLRSVRINNDTIATYSFDMEKRVGTITAVNRLFNCCGKAVSEVSIDGDNINIELKETSLELCKCICTYDITSQISGVSPKKYHVTIIGETETPQTFDIDLSKTTNGIILNE